MSVNDTSCPNVDGISPVKLLSFKILLIFVLVDLFMIYVHKFNQDVF